MSKDCGESVTLVYDGAESVTIGGCTYGHGAEASWRHCVDSGESSIPDEYWEMQAGDDWIRADNVGWSEKSAPKAEAGDGDTIPAGEPDAMNRGPAEESAAEKSADL